MGLKGKSYSVAELSDAGVRRVSVGGSFARVALGALLRAAEEVKLSGTFAYAAEAIPDAVIAQLMSQERRADRQWTPRPRRQIQRGASTRLIAGRTTFAIAHRLSTIRHADRILVMRDGRVVERGTFRELRAAGGLFARLVAEGGFAEPGAAR